MKRLFASTSYATIIAYSNTVIIKSPTNGMPLVIDIAGYDPAVHELADDTVPIAREGSPADIAAKIAAGSPMPPALTDTQVAAIKAAEVEALKTAHATKPGEDDGDVDPLDNAECIAAYKGKAIAVVQEGKGVYKVIDNTIPTEPKLIVWPDVVEPGGYKTNKAAWEVVGKIALKLA